MNLKTITGPPGTGKTTTISNLVRGYVEDEKIDRTKILVGSLTRTAAREAARAVTLPDRQVGTWHSFAYHALGTPQLTEQHLKDWNEQAPERWRISGGGMHKGDTPDMAPGGWVNGDKLMLAYSRNRASEAPRPYQNEALESFACAWEDWKHQCGYLDFADVIERGLDVEQAPGTPSVLMCDEAQDLSVSEARLVAHWAKRADQLVLAGDNHQSIFGWRGSDPLAVQEVWQDIPAAHREDVILGQSYRLSKAVHVWAMRQMRRCTALKMVDYHSRDVEGQACRGASFKDGASLVRSVLRAYPEGSIMFLASCSYMLSSVLKSLHVQGESWHNPWRVTNGAWNPLHTSRGASFYEKVGAFMRPSTALHGVDARYWSVADIKAWTSVLPAKDIFLVGAKKAISELKEPVADRELATRMREWFTPEALPRIAALDLDWFLSASPQPSKTTSAALVVQMIQKRGAAVLNERPRIIVGTVHSLKGAEADVVCVCPDLSPAAAQEAQGNYKMQQELQRVFYVAVTRARETLVLCAPGSRLHMTF